MKVIIKIELPIWNDLIKEQILERLREAFDSLKIFQYEMKWKLK